MEAKSPKAQRDECLLILGSSAVVMLVVAVLGPMDLQNVTLTVSRGRQNLMCWVLYIFNMTTVPQYNTYKRILNNDFH